MIVQRLQCRPSTTDAITHQDTIRHRMQQQQQQQQHIRRLLSTAATGTGIVGDVDALLVPSLHQQQHHQIITARLEPKSERNLWRLEEVKEVLSIMSRTNALDLLNDKSVKSDKVFRNIEQMMRRKGFHKKSHAQIWTKWKFLKSTYMTSRRNRVVPKMIPTEIYEMLHKMLSGNSNDSGHSNAASLDGDCNGDGDNSNDDEAMVNSNTNSNSKDDHDEQILGMAHPIFGFRLGLVKAEPADTGYETAANSRNSTEDDPLATSNSPTVTIKREPDDDILTSTPTLISPPPLLEPPPLPPQISVALQQKDHSLLMPRNTKSMSITAIPSTSNAQSVVNNMTLPPLRIATFAKERHIGNAIQRMERTPPAPVSTNSTLEAEKHCENGTAFIKKMLRTSEAATLRTPLTSTPTNSVILPQRESVLCMPKESTLQLRAADVVSTPRLKQVPMRQTAYSLRPERMIPDLNGPLPTPPLAPSASYQKQAVLQHNTRAAAAAAAAAAAVYANDDELPTTSRIALQNEAKLRAADAHALLKHRKRRLEIPNWCGENLTLPPKISHSIDYKYGAEQLPPTSKLPPKPNNKYQQQNPVSSDSPPNVPTTARKERAAMDEMLKDLAISLRESQLQMINNFFEHQMDMARREHEFFMKQDQLIMDAFQEQSRQLMNTARNLFGLDFQKSHNSQSDNMIDGEADGREGDAESDDEGVGARDARSGGEIDNEANGVADGDASEQTETEPERTQDSEAFINGINDYDQTIENSISNDQLDGNDGDLNSIEHDYNDVIYNAETAVDPIEFVTSELTEESDKQ